jgi:hypothetical protein
MNGEAIPDDLRECAVAAIESLKPGIPAKKLPSCTTWL